MSFPDESGKRSEAFEKVLSCSLSAGKLNPAPKTKERVAVCMSGGVDSSTAALLLQSRGYDVVGLTGWLVKSGSRCCDTGMIDAARVCEQLGVEHHAVDLREIFKTEIIDQFHRAYALARTPVPCSICNTTIKWGALLAYALQNLDADYLATGHYARVVREADGPRLARSADLRKDQSYMLWGLTREQLARTILPLGDYTKSEIRRLAGENKLASAARKESQDLCFIPEGTSIQKYLAGYLEDRPGPLIHQSSGKILGEHRGTHRYTIGQRRGIGVGFSEPLYVCRLDPEKNIVYVGSPEDLLRRELTASQVNWILPAAPEKPFEALAKIRYNSPVEKAVIYPLEGRRLQVVFAEPQPSITAGQILAIFDPSDTYVLGGGWID
jgi:tRNA-uridine 2-sulfurtransferase